MNISKETIAQLNEIYSISFCDDNVNDVSVERATTLHIAFDKQNDAYIGKVVKALKREITFDYVVSKINADRVYKNFSAHFNKLISAYGFSAYPTTYGIGVFVAFGFRQNISDAKHAIENKLSELGVVFTTEYSSGGWVFRYKISKSIENIQIIEKLIS